ncbi:MAG: preprotein translocase subunit SecG [Verrucomicrobia bacterium]|nr:preprotein translocase subunit SecG [Verrucomicrobiota bacterium]
MNFLIGLMTFVLVLDCLFLILVILIQLPKKEAGLGGAAFGSGATDALFGAGTGNVLTKATKYAGILFLVLSLVLYVVSMRAKHQKSGVEKELQNLAGQTTPASKGTAPQETTISAPPMTNLPIATSAPTATPPATTNSTQKAAPPSATNAPAPKK